MAAYCPCGCGKKLSLIERGGGKQVRVLDQRIEFLETYVRPLQQAAGSGPQEMAHFEEFLADGWVFRNQMLAVIHGELDARQVNRRQMNKWGMLAAKMKGNTIGTLYRATHD